jgi:Gram-negative bacterial TonB protein C-terminal
MNKILVGRLQRRGLLLAICLGLVATDRVCAATAAGRPEVPIYQLPIPVYPDWSPWGRYNRRLQDITAARWYDEIIRYSSPSYSYSHGVVTVRYLITPDGVFHNPQIVSNTSNQPMADAVLRALRKTWSQPFPVQIAAIAPGGLVVEQTFRYWNYDPTQDGFASSYPQLLEDYGGRTGSLLLVNPQIYGNTSFLYFNLRQYHNQFNNFPFQSRIIRATAANSQLASR